MQTDLDNIQRLLDRFKRKAPEGTEYPNIVRQKNSKLILNPDSGLPPYKYDN